MLSNNWNPYLDNFFYKLNQKWNYCKYIIADEFIEKYVFLGIFTPGMSNGEENSSTFGADNVLDKNTFYEREFLSNSNIYLKINIIFIIILLTIIQLKLLMNQFKIFKPK